MSEQSKTLYREQGAIADTLPTLEKQKSEIPDPRKTIEEYKEKALLVPLTNEQKRELLKPEVLAELSMPEYISLWRRLNPNFLTHVTRQGFRDHNGMVYHSSGIGEFSARFTTILDDNKQLRPIMEIRGLLSRDDNTIRELISKSVLTASDEAEALTRFDSFINHSIASAPAYPDRTSIHFAVEDVLNTYYGAEDGNEVFFVFPTDVIASQRTFGCEGRVNLNSSGDYPSANNLFVWGPVESEGNLSLDAGIVFLPKSKVVDPSTGSKFASEARFVNGKVELKLIEDSELVNKFVTWGTTLNDESGIIQAASRVNMREITTETFIHEIADELAKIGMGQDAINGILKHKGLFHLLYCWNSSRPNERTSEIFSKILDDSHARWKRVETGVSSEEYWKGYFENNPEKKPKHVVFYDGDPNSALLRFQRDNYIQRTPAHINEGPALGFADHSVTDMKKDPRANPGYADLMERGKRIIHSYYNPPANRPYP